MKMLRRLTATQLVVRVVGNECGEFVDVAGGPRDACEVGARHQDALSCTFGVFASVLPDASIGSVADLSHGSLDTHQDGYGRTVDNQALAPQSKHRQNTGHRSHLPAADVRSSARIQADASLANKQERAVATSIVHGAAAAKP